MHLIHDHVFQFLGESVRRSRPLNGTTCLIIDGPEIDICFKLFAGDSAGKHVLASVVEAFLDEDA